LLVDRADVPCAIEQQIKPANRICADANFAIAES
jgi:hypothetical protein